MYYYYYNLTCSVGCYGQWMRYDALFRRWGGRRSAFCLVERLLVVEHFMFKEIQVALVLN